MLVVCCRLILTLYLGIGDDFNPGNYINMAAVLFMWVTMPAFGAAAYVPSITLGKCCRAAQTQPAYPRTDVVRLLITSVCGNLKCCSTVVLHPCTTHFRRSHVLSARHSELPTAMKLTLHSPPPCFSPAERSLFTRERNDGLYTTFTSLAGKMFDELVINALVA